VESIHELDDNDSEVLCSRNEKLSEAFDVTFDTTVLEFSELGHSVHKKADLCIELGFDVLCGHIGILDRIMQQPRTDRRCVHAHFSEGVSDGCDMEKIRITRISFLVMMSALGKCIRTGDEVDILVLFACHDADDLG
jgi:hypothetical protein